MNTRVESLGRSIRTAGLCAAACLFSVSAWAQTGVITGSVRDASGAVLPGVTVEAASPALIERVRTVTTDASGGYRLEDLRVGTYSVSFTLPGFSTFKRDGLELSSGFTATINAELKVGSLEETITVTGETPVVDVASAKRQITMQNDVIKSIPTTRNYNSLLVLVPGVSTDRNDVATGPLISIFPIHGGRGSDGRMQVDGLTIGNAPGGNQASHYVADVGNSAEVTFATSGGLGEAETGGLIMNVVPKTGGNRFSGSAYYSGTGESLQSNNYTPELKARGLTAATPLRQVYDANGSLGGPIAQDKVWFFVNARTQGQKRDITNLYYNQNAGDPAKWTYEPDFSRPAYSDRTWENISARITWQANQKNKISVFWDEQAICRKCTGSTSFSASPNPLASPEADGYGEYRPQRVQQGRWTSTATNRLLLEAAGGTSYYQWGNGERPGAPTHDLIRVTEQFAQPRTLPDGTAFPGIANLVYRSQDYNENSTNAVTWNAAASFITGRQSIKFGYQGSYFIDDRTNYTNSQNLAYRFGNGVPNQLTQLNSPYEVNARAAQTSFYAQEQLTLNRLTLQGALRFDAPHSWFPEQRVGGTRFLPTAIVFPETEGVTGYRDLTPRMGAAYDAFGNGKTALKVNLGKYLESAATSGIYASPNPTLRLPATTGGGGITPPGVTRTWTDANNNFVPDCDLLNPQSQDLRPAGGDFCGTISNLAFGTNTFTNSFDPDLLHGWGVRGSDWTFGASIQQELFPRASVEVAYVRRWFNGFTVTDNRAYSAADYQSFSLVAPLDSRLPGGGGQTIAGLYDLAPTATFGRVDNLLQATSKVGERVQYANNVDVTLNIRTSNGITMQGGYSTTQTVNDTCEIRAAIPESATVNPYCHTASGFQPQFRGLASYTIPRVDLQVSSVYQDKPGPQLSANYFATNANLAATLGRPLSGSAPFVTVNLVEPGTLYGDRIRQLDGRVAKIVNFAGKRATFGLDVYNVLNNGVILTYNNSFVPGGNWLAPTSIMTPRMARLSVEFTF